MDKNNERQISIKINGKDRTIEEKPKEVDAKVDNFITIKREQFEKQAKSAEESFAQKEVAAAQEADDDFSWVLPDENSTSNVPIDIHPIEDVRDKKSTEPAPYFKAVRPKGKGTRRNHTYTIKHLLTSIILAVVVGLGFGAIILNLISEVDGEQAVVEPGGTPVNNSPASEGDIPPASGTSSLELAALNTAVVQAGSFKNQESANTVVQSVKQAGLPAVAVENEGSFYIYVGIGADKAELKIVENAYIAKVNEEPWSKPFIIDGGSFSNVNEKDATYVTDAQQLYSQMITTSSVAFTSNAITDEQWTSMAALFDKVKDSEGLSEGLQPFSASLSAAYSELESFKTSKDEATLWKSQQSLLDALAYYQTWKNSLS